MKQWEVMNTTRVKMYKLNLLMDGEEEEEEVETGANSQPQRARERERKNILNRKKIKI